MYSTYFLLLLLAVVSCDQWNTKDYMKREHSLMKPYTGMISTQCFLFSDFSLRSFK